VLEQGAFGGTYYRKIKSVVTGLSYEDVHKVCLLYQKSHFYSQKRPVVLWGHVLEKNQVSCYMTFCMRMSIRNVFYMKRAMYIRKRAMHIRKRAMCIRKRALSCYHRVKKCVFERAVCICEKNVLGFTHICICTYIYMCIYV